MKNLKRKGKQNKAITLIALVITIVILIILAGIAINLSLGNNGIFKQAKTATQKYANAQDKEEAELANLEYEVAMNSSETVTISKTEYEQLKNGTISAKTKMGQVTMKGSNNNSVEVIFDEPFEDDNYNICLQIAFSPYFNAIQYGYRTKTEKGFTIGITNTDALSGSYNMTFDWIAIHQ